MCEVVDQARRHAAEHGVSLLPFHVFLKHDQPVGHGVKRLAQPLELVAGGDGDPGIEPSLRQLVSRALEDEDGGDEPSAEEPPDRDHGEERDGDRDDEQPPQGNRTCVGFSRRLLDDDGPSQRVDRRGGAQRGETAFIVVLTPLESSLHRRGGCRKGVAGHLLRLRHERLLVRIAVRDERSVWSHDQREPLLADANPIDHAPHLFEAHLADQPTGRLTEALEPYGEGHRWQ